MTEGSARSPPGARSQPDAQHHQRTRRCSGCTFKRGELFFVVVVSLLFLSPPHHPVPCQQEEQNSVVAHAGTKRINRGERRGERAAGAAQAGPRFKSSCAAATGVYGVAAPTGASHRRHPARAVGRTRRRRGRAEAEGEREQRHHKLGYGGGREGVRPSRRSCTCCAVRGALRSGDRGEEPR